MINAFLDGLMPWFAVLTPPALLLPVPFAVPNITHRGLLPPPFTACGVTLLLVLPRCRAVFAATTLHLYWRCLRLPDYRGGSPRIAVDHAAYACHLPACHAATPRVPLCRTHVTVMLLFIAISLHFTDEVVEDGSYFSIILFLLSPLLLY
jgi:hypothetical protein